MPGLRICDRFCDDAVSEPGKKKWPIGVAFVLPLESVMEVDASKPLNLGATYEERQERLRYLGALSGLPSAIARAEAAMLPFDELLALLPLWDQPYREEVLEQLQNRQRSRAEHLRLLGVLSHMADQSDKLPRRHRARADQTLNRLLYTLPESDGSELALGCIKSRRSLQRKAGYRYFRTHGFTETAVRAMLESYGTKRDQQILELIARDPVATLIAGPEFMLQELEDRYWRMRVLQTLLRAGPRIAEAAASQYPLEFVWACARERDAESLPIMRRILDENAGDPEFVSFCLWAFSELGSPSGVAAARIAAESLIDESEPWIWEPKGRPTKPDLGLK